MKKVIKYRYWLSLIVLTASPPDANEILGISCFAMISPVSWLAISKHLDDMFNKTLVPACSIHGLLAILCCMRFSTRLFFGVLTLAASQTRLIHSLNNIQLNLPTFELNNYFTHFATNDLVWKSRIFIDVFISIHPMYYK